MGMLFNALQFILLLRFHAARACAGLCLFSMVACSSSGAFQTFDLTAARDGFNLREGHGVLVVAEPVALQALDSNRIIIRTRDGNIAYLPGVQWADRLPKLLQARLIESFENGRGARSVARPGDRIVPYAQINLDIRQFGIDEARGEAVVEVTARIINDRSGSVLAAKVFESRVPSGGSEGASASAALDLANQALMRDVVAWAAGRV